MNTQSQSSAQTLPLMPLTLSQRRLLIGMRIFLGLLAVLAVYDFVAGLSS
jgi:hypothetical protein